MDRRKFLKNLSIAGIAPVVLGGVPSQLLQGNAFLKHLAANSTNDRVLIFIQLHGGNDALNTLVPISQYSIYNDIRANIAIPNSGLRPYITIDDTLADDAKSGLHPDMAGFKSLYDDAKAAVIQNVGYENMNLSHFRGRDIVFMGGSYDDYFGSGWMGRFLNHEYPNYPEAYPNSQMPDPLGLEFGNTFSLAYHRDNGIPAGFSIGSPNSFYNLIKGVGIEPPIQFPDSHAGNELRYLMEFEKKSNQYAERLSDVYNNGNNSSVEYPENYPLNTPARFFKNPLSGQLRLIARLLAGGCKTRIFMCRMGLFDTHADQVESYDPTMGAHASLLYHLSEAVKAFQDDIQNLGLEDRVLTMTFTEFGRRAASNNSFGTDHGTSTPVFLFGKGVKAGVYGKNPDLTNLVRGNLQYDIDYRQVYTSVVQDWFGASDQAMIDTKFNSWIDDKLDLIQDPVSINDKKPSFSNIPILNSCYPNPVEENATFSFYLPKLSHVSLKLYDTSGKLIRNIINEDKTEGLHKITENLSDLIKGAYIYRIEIEKFKGAKKLVKN